MLQGNWTDYLYLVAVPSGALLTEAQRLQKVLTDGLQCYAESEALPPIHITLCKVKKSAEDDLPRFIHHLAGVAKRSAPLDIRSSNFQCFTQSHQSLVLKIDDNPQLNQLQQSFQQELEGLGFFVPITVEQWIFHMTVISQLFTTNNLTDKAFETMCQRISLREPPLIGVIESVELWRPVLDPAQRVVAQFPLGAIDQK